MLKTLNRRVELSTAPAKYSVLLDILRFAKGYLRFCITGTNNWSAFYALRRLFCVTNGRINDLIAILNGVVNRPYHIDLKRSRLLTLCERRMTSIIDTLDKDGVYLFEEKVPDAVCDELLALAHSTPLVVIAEDGKASQDKMLINPADPQGIKGDVPMEDLVRNPGVQQILGDPGLLAIAQAYFRSKAVQDLVAMWWSFPSATASSAIAQLYHFDMDRIKFLKFFIYLTDVGPDNGPHCFVRGSHIRLPRALRKDKRHSDEEVFQCFSREQECIITAPKGTLIAVDTRGLHKGLLLTKGHRLIFQVEYALNLFGMEYPRVTLDENVTPEMKQSMKEFPYAFQAYGAT